MPPNQHTSHIKKEFDTTQIVMATAVAASSAPVAAAPAASTSSVSASTTAPLNLSFDPNRQFFTPYRLSELSDPVSVRKWQWDERVGSTHDTFQLGRAAQSAVDAYVQSRGVATDELERNKRLIRQIHADSQRVAVVRSMADFDALIEKTQNLIREQQQQQQQQTPIASSSSADAKSRRPGTAGSTRGSTPTASARVRVNAHTLAPLTPATHASVTNAAATNHHLASPPFYDFTRVPPSKLQHLQRLHAYKASGTGNDAGWWRSQVDPLFHSAAEVDADDDDDADFQAAITNAVGTGAGAGGGDSKAAAAEGIERYGARMRRKQKAGASGGVRNSFFRVADVMAQAPVHQYTTKTADEYIQQHNQHHQHTHTSAGGAAPAHGVGAGPKRASPPRAAPTPAATVSGVDVTTADSRRAAAIALPTAPAGLQPYLTATTNAGLSVALTVGDGAAASGSGGAKQRLSSPPSSPPGKKSPTRKVKF